ncbi:hypothetical protein BU17DRAFT_61509 [Hysterangium stoloniferum]|nr:hypothetical protein BU17DRAFT_61509 [Hysterangium stoloniferum]
MAQLGPAPNRLPTTQIVQLPLPTQSSALIQTTSNGVSSQVIPVIQPSAPTPSVSTTTITSLFDPSVEAIVSQAGTSTVSTGSASTTAKGTPSLVLPLPTTAPPSPSQPARIGLVLGPIVGAIVLTILVIFLLFRCRRAHISSHTKGRLVSNPVNQPLLDKQLNDKNSSPGENAGPSAGIDERERGENPRLSTGNSQRAEYPNMVLDAIAARVADILRPEMAHISRGSQVNLEENVQEENPGHLLRRSDSMLISTAPPTYEE